MTAPEALTYNSLVSDLQTYAERTDTPYIDQIPRFVMLAENRIASEIKGLGLKRFITGNFIPSNAILQKPARWRETEAFSYLENGTRVFLKLRSLEYCRTYWGDQSQTGAPKYYSDYDFEHFFLAATPASANTFELAYYERPEPLSLITQTNWTTQYAPQLLLYATLLEAQPWLKLSERTAEFQAMYDRAAGSLAHEDQQRGIDSEASRSRP